VKIVRTYPLDLILRAGASPRVRPVIEVEKRPEDPDEARADDQAPEADDDDRPSLESTTDELSIDVDLSDVKSPDAKPSHVSDVYDELEGEEPSQNLDVVF